MRQSASHHRARADTIEERAPTHPAAGGTAIVSRATLPSSPAPDGQHALPEAARRGNPSFVWRSGQERRLAIVERYAPLRGRRVLDLGCGLGEYVRAFERVGGDALGCDVEWARLVEGRERGAHGLLAAAGEELPFADASLDVVVLNEVIEHVADDDATLREVARVLRPGGRAVIFAPNRLYPFETHGVTVRGRYIFGNIPLVNWLPRRLRDRLVPHARVYSAGDWAPLVRDAGLEVLVHSYVYPGFDNVAARWPRLGRVVRWLCYGAEGTPLERFGLSHLLVLRHPEPEVEAAR